MNTASDATPGPIIVQWLLDTRHLWPISHYDKARDEVQELKVVASRALSLLSKSEQTSVLKYYHVKDAKMSLASHLLKHLIITKYCHVSWSKSTISRDDHGKPIYVPEAGQQSIDFNVSHQAGIVSLIAAIGYGETVNIGTDVVCVIERRKPDYNHIDKKGFFDWVDMHADVFAPSEVSHMKLGPVTLFDLGLKGKLNGYGADRISRCQRRNEVLEVELSETELDGNQKRSEISLESNYVVDAKLRRFYAMWCLREAYVKMTGEAFLASWLQELEMLGIEAPAAKSLTKASVDKSVAETTDTTEEEATSLAVGEAKRDFRILFKEEVVQDVELEITALGPDFMVAGAVRIPKAIEKSQVRLGIWTHLDLERDVLQVAEAAI